MKRFFFMVLAVTMLAVPMAGCSGDGDPCKDACKNLEACGILEGSVNTCTAECKQALNDGNVDDPFVECIADSSCGSIESCS